MTTILNFSTYHLILYSMKISKTTMDLPQNFILI